MAFTGDGAELVREIAGGGQIGTGGQDAFEVFALAVGEGVGMAHDPGRDPAGAENRPRWFGGCGAGTEGRDVLGDHDAAAAVAAFADLTEQGRSVGGTTEEALLQVGLEPVDVAVRAAIACGGDDLGEVSVQVVADGLAVTAQAGGDRADRPAAFTQLVGVGVPLPDAGQELSVRWVARLRWPDQRGTGDGPGLAPAEAPGLVLKNGEHVGLGALASYSSRAVDADFALIESLHAGHIADCPDCA